MAHLLSVMSADIMSSCLIETKLYVLRPNNIWGTLRRTVQTSMAVVVAQQQCQCYILNGVRQLSITTHTFKVSWNLGLIQGRR